MRVVCLSGGWLWKWKPPDDPGTHYPQAMQLLNRYKFCHYLTKPIITRIIVSLVLENVIIRIAVLFSVIL